MKRYLCVVLFVGLWSAGPGASSAGDYVFQPELDLYGPIVDSVKWFASFEALLTDDVQRSGETVLIGGLCWKANSLLSLSSEYKYVTKGESAGSNEHRPRAAIELTAPVGPVKVALRNRAEYRMKEGKDDYWRYRARVKLKFPETMGLKPFLYEEAFYEFGDKDDWNGNEAGCGFGIPLRDGLELVLDFRICHSLQDDSWGEGTLNVLSSFQVTF